MGDDEDVLIVAVDVDERATEAQGERVGLGIVGVDDRREDGSCLPSWSKSGKEILWLGC